MLDHTKILAKKGILLDVSQIRIIHALPGWWFDLLLPLQGVPSGDRDDALSAPSTVFFFCGDHDSSVRCSKRLDIF